MKLKIKNKNTILKSKCINKLTIVYVYFIHTQIYYILCVCNVVHIIINMLQIIKFYCLVFSIYYGYLFILNTYF